MSEQNGFTNRLLLQHTVVTTFHHISYYCTVANVVATVSLPPFHWSIADAHLNSSGFGPVISHVKKYQSSHIILLLKTSLSGKCGAKFVAFLLAVKKGEVPSGGATSLPTCLVAIQEVHQAFEKITTSCARVIARSPQGSWWASVWWLSPGR